MNDAKILRDTFDIAANDERFGATFYARLFQAHPEVRPMFTRNSSGAQHKMFAQKLAAIVDAVEAPDKLAGELAAIAKSHDGYGVNPEMYGWVGEALLATLSEVVGPDWSPDADRAWRGAYDAVTKAILAR